MQPHSCQHPGVCNGLTRVHGWTSGIRGPCPHGASQCPQGHPGVPTGSSRRASQRSAPAGTARHRCPARSSHTPAGRSLHGVGGHKGDRAVTLLAVLILAASITQAHLPGLSPAAQGDKFPPWVPTHQSHNGDKVMALMSPGLGTGQGLSAALPLQLALCHATSRAPVTQGTAHVTRGCWVPMGAGGHREVEGGGRGWH